MGQSSCRVRGSGVGVSEDDPAEPFGERKRLSIRPALVAGAAFAAAMSFAAAAHAQQAVSIIGSTSSVTLTNNDNCIFPGVCATITTLGIGASIDFTNTGDFTVLGPVAFATNLATVSLGGSITFTNSGNIATAAGGAIGVNAVTTLPFSPIKITNSGDIATAGFAAIGINAVTLTRRSGIRITHSGNLATAGAEAFGIYAATTGQRSDISITNSSLIVTAGFNADGVSAHTAGRNSDVSIVNGGAIRTRARQAEGINATTGGSSAQIDIINSGKILTNGRLAEGIYATTSGQSSPLTIKSSGTVRAEGRFGYGILARTSGSSSPIVIENSGEVYGSTAAIETGSATSTTIRNMLGGHIHAGSGLAIDTIGASTGIENAGLITGFVDLTGSGDTFRNMAGGEFNASKTSDFGGGSDLFVNENGSTLRTADDFFASETTKFIGLERFENKGLITMVDSKAGDEFRLSNTPGGTDLRFVGSGNSTLAIDTFLGGPGSKSDVLIVEGSASGRTRIAVNNTNQSSARYHPVGIPVVFVDGNVDASNFYIDKPIDAGFFDYDLFFVPTGSGFFELKNHTGGGSHLLPQLVTVTHDAFHNSTETWFDQSTDLRALLARGNLCEGSGHAEDVARCQELYNFTPGVWARGAGSWFELDDSATTKANGRTYRHDLKRDLDIWQVESGIDFGKRDILVDGDILVLGVLGGAVESSLNYEALARSFQLSSLEAGAYATYLRGGLFVDTLFKTFFSTIDTEDSIGFPDELDSTTYGIRTDTGYRFGGMRPGPFIEPLATLAISWTHIDDFAGGGNAIDFDDDTDLRGRLGLRVGTSTEVWEGTTMEPFVAGSLWGNLGGDHNATLTSGRREFRFVDEPEDVWGEVSGGVNFFNPGAQSAVFAKVDYVFADETQGVSAKAGMRYNW